MTFQKGRKAYILVRNGEILNVFTSLKKLQEVMAMEDKGFASYSRLSKLPKEDGILIFTTKSKIEYTIHIKIVM